MMPFHGADDLMQEDRRSRIGGWLLAAAGAASVAAVLIASFATNAHAQAGQPSDCSGTATSTAAVIAYPKSGGHGPTSPSQFVTVSNPSATATLWINAVGGTATANTAGSVAISPVATGGVNGLSWWRPGFPPPQTISILSSAASSPYTCAYQ